MELPWRCRTNTLYRGQARTRPIFGRRIGSEWCGLGHSAPGIPYIRKSSIAYDPPLSPQQRCWYADVDWGRRYRRLMGNDRKRPECPCRVRMRPWAYVAQPGWKGWKDVYRRCRGCLHLQSWSGKSWLCVSEVGWRWRNRVFERRCHWRQPQL